MPGSTFYAHPAICKGCNTPAMVKALGLCPTCMVQHQKRYSKVTALRAATRKLRKWLEAGQPESGVAHWFRLRLRTENYDPKILFGTPEEAAPRRLSWDQEVKRRERDRIKSKQLAKAARYRRAKPKKPSQLATGICSSTILAKVAGPNFCQTIWPWA